MNLQLADEKQEIMDNAIAFVDAISDTVKNTEEVDLLERLDTNELGLNSEVKEKDLSTNDEKSTTGVDKTINDIVLTLEENIALEIDKLNLNESVWNKISKSDFADVVKVTIESAVKGILKKKFKINYSTFNDAKEALNDVLDGNMKDAVKNGVDVVIDKLPFLDATAKTAIKSVKNAIIDKTIDSEKYEIVNKQTKLLNRISDNCEKFDEAMKINDEKKMKSVVNSIKKDMKEILPIRETISKAQSVLDKYSLWENKGKEELTVEENELVEKLNACA